MPFLTVRDLNNSTNFKAIAHSENVSEAKRVLIETVTQMRDRPCSCWSWRCSASISSAHRTMRRKAESNLLVALKSSRYMNEIAQALRNYKRKTGNIRHRTQLRCNPKAFMRNIKPLLDRSYFSMEQFFDMCMENTIRGLPKKEVLEEILLGKIIAESEAESEIDADKVEV